MTKTCTKTTTTDQRKSQINTATTTTEITADSIATEFVVAKHEVRHAIDGGGDHLLRIPDSIHVWHDHEVCGGSGRGFITSQLVAWFVGVMPKARRTRTFCHLCVEVDAALSDPKVAARTHQFFTLMVEKYQVPPCEIDETNLPRDEAFLDVHGVVDEFAREAWKTFVSDGMAPNDALAAIRMVLS